MARFYHQLQIFRLKHDKKVWSFIFCIAKPALLINKEWLFYINYCVIVSKQIMMSIIAYNINRLFYKNPPTCSNRHVRRLFRCSDSPNVEARVSGILVGTSNKFYCNHTSEYNSWCQQLFNLNPGHILIIGIQRTTKQRCYLLKSFITTRGWSDCK